MGADQIGFVVKIRRMEDEEHEAMLATLREELSQKQRRLNEFLRYYGVESFVDGFGNDEGSLPEQFDIMGFGSAPPLLLDWVAKASLEELMDEYSSIPTGARDACIRSDPDDASVLLLFAGGMSWGDEPEGACYEYLRDTLRLGLWDLLGIR